MGEAGSLAATSARRNALRADTTLTPVDGGKAGREVYVREMDPCCLRSLKESVVRREGGRRALSLECRGCGREWRVTSSIDQRVLKTFVMHGGPRVGGGYPAA